MIRYENKLSSVDEYLSLDQKSYPNIRIYLGSSKGKEKFYDKVGFLTRSNAGLGEEMILEKKNWISVFIIITSRRELI